MARALPDNGTVIALELEDLHAKVCHLLYQNSFSSYLAQLIEENVANAGLSSKVKVIVGDALESMQSLDPDPVEPFDVVFIDADKKNNVNYFVQAKRLLRRGGVIVRSILPFTTHCDVRLIVRRWTDGRQLRAQGAARGS